MTQPEQSEQPADQKPTYSVAVHRHLLRVHEKRWERMHAHRRDHGCDSRYDRLRKQMLDAAAAVRRYTAQQFERRERHEYSMTGRDDA